MWSRVMIRVSHHAPAVLRGEKLERCERLAHLPETNSSWDLDDDGAPLWLSRFQRAKFCPWYQIVPSEPLTEAEELRWSTPHLQQILKRGPVRMPSFRVTARMRPERQRRGRPVVSEAAPELCRYEAWLADVGHLGARLMARELRLGGMDERSARRTAASHVKAGRRLLHEQGVLPWIVWSRGEVPHYWAHHALFQEALNLWYRSYSSPETESEGLESPSQKVARG